MAQPDSELRSWKAILIGKNPKRTATRCAVLIVASVVIFRYFFLPIRIAGESMAPTYQNGRVNFINAQAYLRNTPKRGDVVGIRLAGRRVMLLKRVVALPGETVAILDGIVHINGTPLAEPYVRLGSDWNREPVTLAADEYFVVGDNRSMDQENHMFGIAHRSRIVGKILL